MRLVVAIGLAMLALWTWDNSGIPVHPLGVAAIIVAFLVGGALLEFWRFRGLPKTKPLPGERAIDLTCYAVCLVPVVVVLLFGVDTATDWPVLAGLAAVLGIQVGYAAWLRTR